MKVLLTFKPTVNELSTIRAGLPEQCQVVAPKSHAGMLRFSIAHSDIADLCVGVEAVIGWVMPAETWQALPDLKALAWLHAGTDELDYAMLKRRGVRVANIRGGNSIAVAEHAMGLILGLAKRLIQRHQWVQESHWQPIWQSEYIGTLLEGKTLTMVGLGMIGTAVAKRAKAFDMRVVGVRRHPELVSDYVEKCYGSEELHEALAQADIAVIATPITRDTVGFIDATALQKMKKSALLVNVARGNLINEAALYSALTEGRLAGYAADVWWTYDDTLPPSYHFPIPSRTGLHKLPNVVATGDQASNVAGVPDRLIAMGTESVAAFFRQQPMPREINLDLGY